MMFTVIKKNSYQDSVNLMLLTKNLSEMEGVERISIMMGTPANKDIFKNSGLYTEKLEDAGPNDICIVVDGQDESIVDRVLEKLEDFLKNQAVQSKGDRIQVSRTWDSAISKLPDANLALISIAGEYAAEEASKALDRGLNVFIFSDNVGITEEKRLKEKARDKGLLVMGPDCGTGIINGIPLAFANVVEKGNIGIIGASGTGIQEVSTIVGRNGGGITQAIGIGGRDLAEEIGGITALSAIEVLANDVETEVIVFISKPPAKRVRDDVVLALTKIDKPVVAIFIGEKPGENHDNIHYVWTLEDAANKALELANNNIVKLAPNIEKIIKNKSQRGIKGLYSGGTLAAEAAMIIADILNIEDNGDHKDGLMLRHGSHEIIDLGDDAYTRGRPHPMIDPTVRVQMVEKAAENPETAIILMDFVIGYGGHEDVAGVFGPAVSKIREKLEKEDREILFVASVTGTEEDPQVYREQLSKLVDAGIIVLDNNAKAVNFVLELIHYMEKQESNPTELVEVTKTDSLWNNPKVINIGLRHFAQPIVKHGGQVLNYVWHPIAGGNKKLASILSKLK